MVLMIFCLKKKSLVLEPWAPVELAEHVLNHNHQLVKESSCNSHGKPVKGESLQVTRLGYSCSTGCSERIQLLIRLDILEHPPFPFIAQQHLNPSGFTGLKVPTYCGSAAGTSSSRCGRALGWGNPHDLFPGIAALKGFVGHSTRRWAAAGLSLTDRTCHLTSLSCPEPIFPSTRG